MAWITSNSVSVSNGSKTVSVSGNVDLSSVDEGWGVQIGENKLVEASSGTAPNGSGVSTLTLFEPWPNGSVSAATMKIIPNSGYQIALAKRIKSIADRTVDVMQLQHDYTSQLGQVTATDPDTNEQHTYNTLRQNQQSLDAALDNHAQSINELLDNKTAGGNDTTPGALLAVGATVKQLDLTNSNIRYEPSEKPTLHADFANNKCTIYDSTTNTYIDKAITDVFDITRDTPTTVTTPTGKAISIGIDKPAFDFKDGVAQGLRTNQRYTNLIRWSNDVTAGGWSSQTGATAVYVAEGDYSIINKGEAASRFVRPVDVDDDSIYTLSVSYDLSNSVNGVKVAYYDTDAGFIEGLIHPSSNSFASSSPSVISKFITTSRDGWVRASISFKTGVNSGSNQIQVGRGNIYTEGDSVGVKDVQLTKTPYPMPCAKTEGLEVTVEPDSVKRTLGDELNKNDFSMLLQCKVPNYSNFETIASVGSSNTEEIRFGCNIDRFGFVLRAGSTQTALDAPRLNYPAGSTAIMLLTAITNSDSTVTVKGYINGVHIGDSLMEAIPIGVENLNIGERRNNSLHSNTAVSYFDLYPKSLPEAEAIQLTRGTN